MWESVVDKEQNNLTDMIVEIHVTVSVFCSSMSSCSKQLQKLLEENLSQGPAHTRTKPRGHVPAPLVPMGLSNGENLWVNCTCITTACSHTFKHANGLVAWEFHSTSSMHCVFILQDLLDVNTLELGRQLTSPTSFRLQRLVAPSSTNLYQELAIFSKLWCDSALV